MLCSHTHLTHSYILKRDLPSQLEKCQCIAVVLCKQGKLYLIEEMWWKDIDSTLHLYYYLNNNVKFCFNFNFILLSSLDCDLLLDI